MQLIGYWFCVVGVAVGFVAWKSRRARTNASSTVVRKCFHLLALAIYIPGVIYEPYITHLASSVAVAAFIFIEVKKYILPNCALACSLVRSNCKVSRVGSARASVFL